MFFSRKKWIFLTATSMRKFWLTWNGTFFARTIIARSQNWKNDVLSSVKKYLTPRQESYYNNIILKHVLYQLTLGSIKRKTISWHWIITRSWDSWYWMIILPPFRKRCDNYISDFKNEKVNRLFSIVIIIWEYLLWEFVQVLQNKHVWTNSFSAFQQTNRITRISFQLR